MDIINPCGFPDSNVTRLQETATFFYLYRNCRSSILQSNDYFKNIIKKIKLDDVQTQIVRMKIGEYPGIRLKAGEKDLKKGIKELLHDYVFALFISVKSNLNYEASKTTTIEGSRDPYPGFNTKNWREGLCLCEQLSLYMGVSLSHEAANQIYSYDLVNANDWSITEMELSVAASANRRFSSAAVGLLDNISRNQAQSNK